MTIVAPPDSVQLTLLGPTQEKTCVTCGEIKPLPEFLRHRDTYMKTCHECILRYSSSKTKTCRTCGVIKPLSEFYLNPQSSDGYFTRCKACDNIYRRPLRRASYHRMSDSAKTERVERHRIRTLVEKYGMTPLDYQEMVAAQQGSCAICGCAATDERNTSDGSVE